MDKHMVNRYSQSQYPLRHWASRVKKENGVIRIICFGTLDFDWQKIFVLLQFSAVTAVAVEQNYEKSSSSLSRVWWAQADHRQMLNWLMPRSLGWPAVLCHDCSKVFTVPHSPAHTVGVIPTPLILTCASPYHFHKNVCDLSTSLWWH